MKVGDEVAVRQKSSNLIIIRHSVDTLTRSVPEWLSSNFDNLSVRILDLPSRHQIDIPVAENLIVEFYSK